MFHIKDPLTLGDTIKNTNPSNLALGVCALLDYFHTKAEKEIIFEDEEYTHLGPQRKGQHTLRKVYSTTD